MCDGIRLTWQTVSERDEVGFRLYRSATGNELDALSVTPDLVLALGGGTAYTLDDIGAKPGLTYTYWLRSVDPWGAERTIADVQVTPQGCVIELD